MPKLLVCVPEVNVLGIDELEYGCTVSTLAARDRSSPYTSSKRRSGNKCHAQ
jgi:hypothetical protein